MKYSVLTAIFGVLLLSACSTANGLVHDAAGLSNSAVGAGTDVGTRALTGATNLLNNLATDVENITNTVVGQLPH